MTPRRVLLTFLIVPPLWITGWLLLVKTGYNLWWPEFLLALACFGLVRLVEAILDAGKPPPAPKLPARKTTTDRRWELRQVLNKARQVAARGDSGRAREMLEHVAREGEGLEEGDAARREADRLLTDRRPELQALLNAAQEAWTRGDLSRALELYEEVARKGGGLEEARRARRDADAILTRLWGQDTSASPP